jgi:TRAP transporter 4TM/12TM fusion protein
MAIIYAAVEAIQALFGPAAGPVLATAAAALYVVVLGNAARHPDLALDDPTKPIVTVPDTWPTVRTGLHYLIPVTVLVWCLTADQLTPALAAFWASVTMIAILATQRPLKLLFRRQPGAANAFGLGLRETLDGLALGARNMISIGVATATAGLIVGSITLTGIGLMLTEFIESISGGSVLLMLIITAFISLLLGMGVPTTANYILVATLMAPIVVELGAQGGLVIPLIAVHLFVFYFGIMADVTPPVGLASFAAAAISGEDPIKTGIQGSIYEMRTAVLPFMFIYNPQILLIDIGGIIEFVAVIAATLGATLIFSAATMGWFVVRSRWYETAALLLACLLLFRPDIAMDRIYPPLVDAPASQLMQRVDAAPTGSRIIVVIEGEDIDDGRMVRKTIGLPLSDEGDARTRLATSGADFVRRGNDWVVSQVRFGSYAKRMRLEPGWTVIGLKVHAERPSQYWIFAPAFLLIGLVWLVQRGRRRPKQTIAAAASL